MKSELRYDRALSELNEAIRKHRPTKALRREVHMAAKAILDEQIAAKVDERERRQDQGLAA
jgi:hypothetical protein